MLFYDMNNETEKAWAAGFYDGEGNFRCASYRRKGYNHVQTALRLTVQQLEREPLDRFCAAVGVGKVYGPYSGKGHRNEYYQYAIAQRDAVDALNVLWPYLSEPKKEQVLAALDQWDSRPLQREKCRSNGNAVL